MNDILVSVIIPVYNGEKYLKECIESLLNQTLKECEFIFIDDGSTDDSSIIINEYKSRDDRIKLINQKNQGVSVARNNGLKVARGKYIGFVDADDYVDKDMFYKLYLTSEDKNSDFIMCNFKTTVDGYEKTSTYYYPEYIVMNREYIIENIIYKMIESGHLNAIWNKLYKKEIIYKYNIEFTEGMKMGEDGIFNFQYFQVADSFVYIPYVGYHYREVSGSATRNIKYMDYFKDDLYMYNQELPIISNIYLDEDKVYTLKMKKFINSVISNIYRYLVPNKDISIHWKLNYVKKMINSKEVRTLLPIFIENYYDEKGNYEKAIIKMIKNKSVIGLYLLTIYSWFRNRH